MKTAILAISASLLLSACSSLEFRQYGDNGLWLRKVSDLCAAGMPSAIMGDLRAHARMICTGRSAAYVEVEAIEEIGVPLIRCASAELSFRCEAQAQKRP